MNYPTYFITTSIGISALNLSTIINKNYQGPEIDTIYWGSVTTNTNFEDYANVQWADSNDYECSWYLIIKQKTDSEKITFEITPKYSGVYINLPGRFDIKKSLTCLEEAIQKVQELYN